MVFRLPRNVFANAIYLQMAVTERAVTFLPLKFMA